MRKLLTLSIFIFLCFNLSAQYQHDSIPLKNGYLHFYTKGAGVPLVLLQGGPGFSSYYMRAIADSLPGYRCILIDYEGTGRSQYRKPDTSWVNPDKVVADIEKVRQKLGIANWIVLGHSYGTHFGLSYAIQHPQRVQRIILLSSIGTDNRFQRYSNDNAMLRLTDEDKATLGSIEADTSLNPVDKEFKMQATFLKAYFFDKQKIASFISSIPAPEKNIFFSNDFFNAYFDHSGFWKWDIAAKAYALQKR